MPPVIRNTNRWSRSGGKEFHHYNPHGSNSWWSAIFCLLWTFILFWIGFLGYCWYYGFINDAKINTLKHNVDLVLNRTEESLLRGSASLTHVLHHPQQQPHVLPSDLLSIDSEKKSSTSLMKEEVILPKPSEDDVFIIFSTDCEQFQDWQTLILFHSAKRVKQKGQVIRITSGCSEEKKKTLTDLYNKLYQGYYYAHFTPDFKKDEKTGKKYNFYNKPWGLKHWLEHSEQPIPDNAIVALLDPDMVLLRPITPYIASQPYLISKRIPKEEIIDRIGEGHPVAQQYGLGAPWTNDNHRHFRRGKICGEGSPCLESTMTFGELHFSVGPPYIVQKQDFIKIANAWTTFVPRVYEQYPYLLAEMYAYSMASAHLRLPHLQLDHYMVSNVDAGGEGWEWVDALPQVCLPPEGEDHVLYPGQNLPTVAHYCQSYHAGDFFWGKRRVPKNLFDCSHPLLSEIPPSTAQADYYLNKKENNKKEKIKSAKKAKRDAFMVCTIYSAVNLALQHYKDIMCGPGNQTNYQKTFNI